MAIERRREADPIGCWIPTDPRLSAMRGPLGPTRRMGILGNALMETLEAHKPMFHVAVVGGKPMRTEGTTIFVTGRTKDDGETIVATWDYGESVMEVLRRLSRIRDILNKLPSSVAYEFLKALDFANLPPPQALISDCIVADEQDPQTSLFGCGAGAPISIAVGVERTHIVMDHRLYDPKPHLRTLVHGFQERVVAALAEAC
jgi:hypothetical protein